MTSAATSLAVLVTGAGGQLGSDLLDVLRPARDVVGCRGLLRSDLDVADPMAVADTVTRWAAAMRSGAPGARLVVVNAAAYTAVDAAEDDEETAYAVNAAGPALLAAACQRVGAQLLHVSTDYVFPGDRPNGPPYEVDDATGPRSADGRTKLAGELAVREMLPVGSWVVRTAWVYGATGANFVKTMARLQRERGTVSVVADQTGSPTWSRDLAEGLAALLRADPAPGTYHCTNAGETTWFGFTQAIFAELGADPAAVTPTTSADFPRPAPRPEYSVLSSRAWEDAGLPVMPPWRDALARAFAAEGPSLRA
ncbi:MAG TPA: dTDP-4-dehydrorhamnose reductase [Mycobacteriales bacterium]|nr:dTDP-4-dehydrorhamnose reductase [Mycobacteriales bacterium]